MTIGLPVFGLSNVRRACKPKLLSLRHDPLGHADQCVSVWCAAKRRISVRHQEPSRWADGVQRTGTPNSFCETGFRTKSIGSWAWGRWRRIHRRRGFCRTTPDDMEPETHVSDFCQNPSDFGSGPRRPIMAVDQSRQRAVGKNSKGVCMGGARHRLQPAVLRRRCPRAIRTDSRLVASAIGFGFSLLKVSSLSSLLLAVWPGRFLRWAPWILPSRHQRKLHLAEALLRQSVSALPLSQYKPERAGEWIFVIGDRVAACGVVAMMSGCCQHDTANWFCNFWLSNLCLRKSVHFALSKFCQVQACDGTVIA